LVPFALEFVALLLPIALIGTGIDVSWGFILQHVMSGAKKSEENIAAASVATVQQAGIAFGAALHRTPLEGSEFELLVPRSIQLGGVNAGR
jgi:hypothetical protein